MIKNYAVKYKINVLIIENIKNEYYSIVLYSIKYSTFCNIQVEYAYNNKLIYFTYNGHRFYTQ